MVLFETGESWRRCHPADAIHPRKRRAVLGAIGVDDLALNSSLKCRPCKCLEFWRNVLHAPPIVLKVIKSGNVLSLLSKAMQFCGNNQASALENADFVCKCIAA